MIDEHTNKTTVEHVVIDLKTETMSVIEALCRIDAYKANSYGDEVYIDYARRAVVARRTVTA